MRPQRTLAVSHSETGFRWKRLFDSQPDYMYRRRLLKNQANGGGSGVNNINDDRTSGPDARGDSFTPLHN